MTKNKRLNQIIRKTVKYIVEYERSEEGMAREDRLDNEGIILYEGDRYFWLDEMEEAGVDPNSFEETEDLNDDELWELQREISRRLIKALC